MLKEAILSKLPVIAVHTRDVVNVASVLQNLTGSTPLPFKGLSELVEKSVYYFFPPAHPKAETDYVSIYSKFIALGCSLVIVNPPKVLDPMFDAGEMPVPIEMVRELISTVLDDEDKVNIVLRSLGGCTIREASEFSSLAMSSTGELSGRAIMRVRKEAFQGSDGLTLVSTDQHYYDAPQDFEDYIEHEKDFFLFEPDIRLRPRGLLLDGPAGTGKTAGAKHIAARWQVPLYRLDVASTQNKYVGESERNLLNNLNRMDQEEPCVLLIDEIEKIFGGNINEGTGTTAKMLSQILWWLAERRSRVYVVATTNNQKILPPELYRAGRIDRTFEMLGLTEQQATPFISNVLGQFDSKLATPKSCAAVMASVKKQINEPLDASARFPQALLTSHAYAYVKHVRSKKPKFTVK